MQRPKNNTVSSPNDLPGPLSGRSPLDPSMSNAVRPRRGFTQADAAAIARAGALAGKRGKRAALGGDKKHYKRK